MARQSDYEDNIRRIRSLLIVTSLQKRDDIHARDGVEAYQGKLAWEPLVQLMIDQDAWDYVVGELSIDPKMVFCHPEILKSDSTTSLYYRGFSGLSLKAIRGYAGAVENLEAGSPRARLDDDKALAMARTYNTFICSIIGNSVDWTLENGYRTIVATLGISIDGTMRNKIGEMAEERVRSLILLRLIDDGLISAPAITRHQADSTPHREFSLSNGITLLFGSEPDVSFKKDDDLLAVVEVKGGTDPAGALERYGAAKKSFQHAIDVSPRCKTFYVAAVFTDELDRRIRDDRLVEKTFDLIQLLDDRGYRESFFSELFHHTLRIV